MICCYSSLSRSSHYRHFTYHVLYSTPIARCRNMHASTGKETAKDQTWRHGSMMSGLLTWQRLHPVASMRILCAFKLGTLYNLTEVVEKLYGKGMIGYALVSFSVLNAEALVQ